MPLCSCPRAVGRLAREDGERIGQHLPIIKDQRLAPACPGLHPAAALPERTRPAESRPATPALLRTESSGANTNPPSSNSDAESGAKFWQLSIKACASRPLTPRPTAARALTPRSVAERFGASISGGGCTSGGSRGGKGESPQAPHAGSCGGHPRAPLTRSLSIIATQMAARRLSPARTNTCAA